MIGARETPQPGNGASADAAFAWGDGFMDLVAKYERNSERQLYVYGISVSRCASCRHKLKSDATECENCGHAVPTKSQACMRCKAPKPGLWCFECDAYFCDACHSAPHVLVLNGTAPEKHNCFPIDGSSGKLIRHGAWSSPFLALAKTARRSQMKLWEDAAKAADAKHSGEDASLAARMESLRADEKTRPVDKERKQAAKETTRRNGSSRPPPVPTASSRAPPSTHSQASSTSAPPNTAARSRSPSPAPAAARQQPHPKERASPSPSSSPTKPTSAPPAPARPSIVGEVSSAVPASSTSRKRKSPTADSQQGGLEPSSRVQPVQPTPVPARNGVSHDTATPAAAATTSEALDGMSLHARLLQMKNKKFQQTHSGAASPATTPKREPAMPPSTSNPPPLSAASQPVRPPGEAPLATGAIHTQHSEPATPRVAASTAASASSTPTAQPPNLKADPTLDEVMSRPIEAPPAPLVGDPAGPQLASSANASAGASSSSISSSLLLGSENVLADSIVAEFEGHHAHVVRIEGRLQMLLDAVRKASATDVRRAAVINQRADDYRNALHDAYEHRERALAKVILFTPQIRRFAHGLAANKLFDVSQVVLSSYKKCADLAQKIRDAQAKLKQLNEAIDSAVSSSDPEQLAQLPTISANSAAVEEQLRGHRKDREGQFQLLFQFSKSLRDKVHSAFVALDTKRESQG